MRALFAKIREILRDRHLRRIWTRVISVMASVVVFISTYALILPAITMESEAACGIEAHQHTDECYEDVLTCGQEESEDHQHTDACYTRTLICGKEAHIHSAECYKEDSSAVAVSGGTAVPAVTDGSAGDSSSDQSSGNHQTGQTSQPTQVDVSDASGPAADADGQGAGAEMSGTPENAGTTVTAEGLPADANTLSDGTGYVPVLDILNFDSLLTKETGFYYFHAEEGQPVPENSSAITDWKKLKNNMTLASTDLVKAYLAYSIPAGALNETNQTARYRLPANIHLTDDQIQAINRTENGVAAAFAAAENGSGNDSGNGNSESAADGSENTDSGITGAGEADAAAGYEKYLGAEAVEGTRTPDKTLRDGAQEYISATVRAENVYEGMLDENGNYIDFAGTQASPASDRKDLGDYIGQDLIFTFTPYTVQKNQNTYDMEGNPLTAGEKVTGWFAVDFNMDQIDWVEEDTDLDKSTVEKSAEVIFALEDASVGSKERKTTLRLEEQAPAGENGTEDTADQDKDADENADLNKTDKDATDSKDAEENAEKAVDAEDAEKAADHTDGTLTADGDGYSITLAYTADAQIPENASLSVEEITPDTDPEAYEACLQQAAQKMGASIPESGNAGTNADANTGAASDAADAAKAGAPALDTAASRFFDIEIVVTNDDGKTEKIEPKAPVAVNIQLSSAPEAAKQDKAANAAAKSAESGKSGEETAVDSAQKADPTVLHFAEEGVEEMDATVAAPVDGNTANGKKDETGSGDPKQAENAAGTMEISFEAESFSIYGVVYTVDFEYTVNGKVYQFSLKGGDKINLSELVDVLGMLDDADYEDTDAFLADVENVEFSDESLVKITHRTPVLGIFGFEDWVLESLQAFDTTETLTITMKNGDKFVVKVTDAQISADVLTDSGETYTITVEYDDDAEIPDDAKLNVTEILPGSEAYAEYYEKAHLALGDDAGAEDGQAQYARFFDITILSGDRKVEPQADVSVSIALKDTAKTEETEWKLVHFENEQPDVLAMEETEDETTGETTIAFVTDSFSVYGVVTVPAPSSVNDLNGYSVKISNLGYYLGADNITVGDSRRISKTNSESDAPVWTIEATGTAGRYNIYTVTEEGKKYINIKKSTDQRGDAMLSDEPQALTVTENENSYRICGTDNGSTYYLNQFDNITGIGFAGWWYNGSDEAQLDFTFVPPLAETDNKEYMVVVKRGDEYFVVLNDGTLSPAQYNEADNTVVVDDPMMWKYDGERLYHVTREAGFTGDDIPSDSYYRYIDPNSSSGLSEDDETNTTATGDLVNRLDVHITERNLWNNVKLSYTDHKLRSVSDPGYYIGVDEMGRLCGQVSAENAVEVFLADPLVQESEWTRHSVGHIDISINGTAEADVPLAYGKYYDENGNVVKEVEQNQFEKLHLTRAQVVNADELSITPADMMRCHITATCNGETLDNAFYVTGYSGNAEHGGHAGGETDYITSPQVRIEGSFLVAQMPENHATVDTWSYDFNPQYRNAIREEHLANQVEYNVSVAKSVEFYLQMPVLGSDGEQLTDEDGDPVFRQLYDADGTALKIRVDLAFSDSFTYWDEENECPVFTDTDRWYYYKNYNPSYVGGWNAWNAENWEAGDIARCGFSGMDFKLGGSGSQPNSRIYAIEITKIVVDEQGNRIKSDDVGTTKFNIYRKQVETIPSVKDSSDNEFLDVIPVSADDDVKGLNIGSFSSDETYSEGYSFLRGKTIQVGNDGFGLVYDYDVSPALYYVEEDPDSVRESITDTAGKQWDYKQTYILTEYAWRNHANDNYMHVGRTYTEAPAEGGYKSTPEILGNHFGYNGTDGPYTNDFLEFYVYNVYEAPKVDVPVTKTWDDFSSDEFDWRAGFKLQWAPVYPDETKPTVAFQDVSPERTVELTKAMMAAAADGTETPEQLAARSFTDLPKYGTDQNGDTFRYQYSLEEISYQVWNSATGVVLYEYSKDEGYSGEDSDTIYLPFYPHDAGENDSELEEENAADENYYISVENIKKEVRESKYIDINLEKRWDDSFPARDDTYWAEFELRRFSHTEYRDLSEMSDADRTADPVTVTIMQNGEVVSSLQAQPNMGLYLGGNFMGHSDPRSATFTANHPVRLANGSNTTTLTAQAGSNMSNAVVRTQEFFVVEDTVFTIGDGFEYLVADRPAQVLDTSAGTSPLPDHSFSQTIRLDSTNNWQTVLEDLLVRETTVSGDNNNENVTCYEYYLVEKDSNPKGYAQYFRLNSDGTVSTTLSGDADHQIEADDSIVAVNGPANRLRVKKLWRGVPDNTGFPAITFTLYQTWADGNDGWVYENPDTHARYEHIELGGNALEWICPESLPATRLDGSTSRAVKYYVMEDERSGSVTNGGVSAGWKFYYYLTSEGQQTNAGHQGYFAAINGQNILDNPEGGTITICNAMNAYMQMDIQKQFFLLGSDGSWDNVTANNDMKRGAILGFQVIRAVKAPDGKWLDASGNESDTPVWMDYGEEMLCGYDEDGHTVVSRGENDIFWLHDAGGDWHFRIENNEGDHSNVSAGGAGLPSYGFFIRNGEDLPVEYWYSFREIGVYKNLNKDPYPEWDWFSSVTPVNAYGPTGTMEAFPKAFHGQDEKRIANFQASDLIIDKDWIGEPSAGKVYIKIWRTSGGGEPEDFTAVIADDIRSNNNWQYYVNDVSAVDLGRNCLVLDLSDNGSGSASIKVNRALLGALSETGSYNYYIQEIGYCDNQGVYRTNVNAAFKPLYDHWVDGAYTGSPVQMNDYESNSITIAGKGQNRLKVTNSAEPSTSYTVTKAFYGAQSSTGGQSSVTGKYPTDGSKQVVVELQQRYRYEKTEEGVDYVSADNSTWVTADSEDAKTTWCNYSSNEGWQSAESASPTSIVLPLDKPEGSILSDEAWYGSAAAWTYTWEGLDVVKVVSNAENPENSPTAQLYYRAVEVSTPNWFSSVIAEDEQNGHKAVANGTTAAVPAKNTVTNNRKETTLNLNKEWTGLGAGKTWPDNVTIDYQLVQYFHLALADMSHVEDGHIVPEYSAGTIFKSVEMTTTNSGAATADSVHPQAIGLNVGKPADGSTVIANITGLPMYGFLTATEADVAEAAEHGVTLVAGKVYPVVYTYGAKETAVKRNDESIPFKEQTVEAERDGSVADAIAYTATLTNELVSVTVEKEWNGLTPNTEESATITLYRFEKEPEVVPDTTFQYTVTVTGDSDALNSNGTVTAVIYNEEDGEVGRYTLKKNDWSHTFDLEIGGTYHAVFTGDGMVLDAAVTPPSASNITEAGSVSLTATVKPAASGRVKVSVTGSPSGLWMNPLRDSTGTELSPQKKFNEYFDGNGGETTELDGLIPGERYSFQIGAAPSSVDGAEYSGGFITFTAVDGLHTITLNYGGGSGGDSNATSGSFTGSDNYWGINDWNNLTIGQTYSFIFQVGSDPTQYTVTATGVTSCSYSVTNNWGNGGQITVTFVPASADEEVVITATNSTAQSLQTGKRASVKSATGPLRAPAAVTWTNNTTGLPAGANPNTDELVDTIVFSGTTWSKTWTELPKYSEDGKEYVYYAYETAYTGASGATALETTYSMDEDGNWTVTNTPTYPDLGNLKVTKEVMFGSERDIDADGLSFTVGIFSDSAGTTRVSGQADQTITVQDGYGEATFTGLTAGSYYVYEIVDDEPVITSGTAATIDETNYTVTYTKSSSVVSNGETATAAIENTKALYSLNVLKIDKNDSTKTLDGAVFQLNKLMYNAETQIISYAENSAVDVTTANGGTAAFSNLTTGYYEIKETKAPDGYILKGDSTFYIKVTSSGIQLVIRDDSKAPDEWETATGNNGAVTYVADSRTATVVNEPGAALPSTGGPGTTALYLLGIMLTGLAGAGLVMRKRRRVAV